MYLFYTLGTDYLITELKIFFPTQGLNPRQPEWLRSDFAYIHHYKNLTYITLVCKEIMYFLRVLVKLGSLSTRYAHVHGVLEIVFFL